LSIKPLFRHVKIRDRETGEVRVIEGGISHCSSPVAPLLESIKQCVASIVPELGIKGVSLHFDRYAWAECAKH